MPGGTGLRTHPLVHARLDRGWSQQVLLTRLRATARHTRGITLATNRHTLSRWENGHQTPDPTTQLCLADLLDIPENHVHRAPWPAWLPRGPLPTATLAWDTAGATTALRYALASATDNRGFLVADPHLLHAAVAHWRTPPPPEPPTPQPRPSAPANPQTAATAHRRTADLRDHFLDRGCGTLTALAYEELRHLTGHLDARHTPDPVRPLFAAAAELAHLTGWINADNTRHAAAQTCYLAAVRAAHIADEPLLAANAILSLAMQTAELGTATDAVTILNALHTAIADQATPRVLAITHADLARAHSRTPHPRPEDVHDNLAAARAHLASATDVDDDPPWCASLDAATISGHAAAAHLHLDDPASAHTEARAALHATPPNRARERTALLIRLARAGHALGHTSEADHHLDQAQHLLDTHVDSPHLRLALTEALSGHR